MTQKGTPGQKQEKKRAKAIVKSNPKPKEVVVVMQRHEPTAGGLKVNMLAVKLLSRYTRKVKIDIATAIAYQFMLPGHVNGKDTVMRVPSLAPTRVKYFLTKTFVDPAFVGDMLNIICDPTNPEKFLSYSGATGSTSYSPPIAIHGGYTRPELKNLIKTSNSSGAWLSNQTVGRGVELEGCWKLQVGNTTNLYSGLPFANVLHRDINGNIVPNLIPPDTGGSTYYGVPCNTGTTSYFYVTVDAVSGTTDLTLDLYYVDSVGALLPVVSIPFTFVGTEGKASSLAPASAVALSYGVFLKPTAGLVNLSELHYNIENTSAASIDQYTTVTIGRSNGADINAMAACASSDIRCRTLGSYIWYKNVSQEDTKGGRVDAALITSGASPAEFAPYMNSSDLSVYPGATTHGLEHGFYQYWKPSTIEDLQFHDLVETDTVHPPFMASVINAGAAGKDKIIECGTITEVVCDDQAYSTYVTWADFEILEMALNILAEAPTSLTNDNHESTLRKYMREGLLIGAGLATVFGQLQLAVPFAAGAAVLK